MKDEAALRLLLEQMPAVLWSTDRDLRFTSSVGASLAALGLQPGQVVGMTLAEYFKNDEPAFPPLVAHLQALAGHSGEFDLEWQGRCFRAHVEPLRNAAGEITGTIGVANDVTLVQRTAAELRRRDDELRQAQKMEAVGRLAGGVAHDFDRQLAVIAGYAHSLLRTMGGGDPRTREVEQILGAVQSASTLTR